MKCLREIKQSLTHKSALVLALALTCLGQFVPSATAYVQVRISIKFIVDQNNNRPATGNLNTDAEINAEVNWANTILANNMSEFRVELLELVDLTGVSQWYNADSSDVNRDNLRSAAISNPTTYQWRTDAINMYINAGTGSAVSDFPPDNNIILMNQWCSNTPSCVLHEMGHSLNLYHTHQLSGDGCGDTITDDQNWTRDQIAQNNFGTVYANLTAQQQDQVDLVFNNVMSYHTSEPQLRFSYCQRDRISTQADSDRAWLLTREPVYVNSAHTGSESGRFVTPYKTLQSAISAGLFNKVVVFQQGSYTKPTSLLSEFSYLVTRVGPSTIGQGCMLYSLPVDLERSRTLEVRNPIQAVQSEDKAARAVMRNAKTSASLAVTAEEKSSLIANAEAIRKQHEENAVVHLLQGEEFAGGQEKVAIQLELAQRYKFSGDWTEATIFFMLVADNTEQPHLRVRALYEANQCQKIFEKSQHENDTKK